MRGVLDTFTHLIRRATGFYVLKEQLDMVHDDIAAQVARTDRLTASLPGIVQTAVANAEAAKDSDHADDVAAVTASNDRLEAALDGLAPPAPSSADATATTAATDGTAHAPIVTAQDLAAQA